MPHGVVGFLEQVQVHANHREAGLFPARGQQRGAKAVIEQGAVWQMRQRVVHRLVRQLLVQLRKLLGALVDPAHQLHEPARHLVEIGGGLGQSVIALDGSRWLPIDNGESTPGTWPVRRTEMRERLSFLALEEN